MTTSDAALRNIIDSATDAIVTANGEGVIVTWNPAAEEMFGHDSGVAVGQSLTMVIPDRFHDAHHAGMQRVVDTGETRIIGTTVQVAGKRADGTEFPIELSLSTWIEDGERFFSGIIRDVSEREAMSRELLRTEHRLEAILGSANDAIISIDDDGRIILWNSYAEDLFGFTAEEVMGEPMSAIIPERFRDGHASGLARVVSGGERHVIGQTVELAALHKDGREFPIELSLATWEDGDEQLFVGIIRDITERKQAEQAVHLANKQLNQKNEQLEAVSAKLAKYLSRQVYDSIFEGRKDVKVESYRKELTVFFSDIMGFTDLTDRLEAEPLSKILNSYLSEMSTIADGCGGTIDKFIGDGIMIFFGDPETRGRRSDALECVRMAIRMRKRIMELRQEWVDLTGTVDLRVRMGINTGYCTVGNFGSDERMDYTIVGGPVNIASRLESTAAADQIHISHETYMLIKDEIYCRPTGDIKVKGVSHDLRTYEVVAERQDMDDDRSISAASSAFALELDPTALSKDDAEEARKALQEALAALDDANRP